MSPFDLFENIVKRWLRIVGFCVGRDILHENFKIDVITFIILLFLFLLPLLYLWTAYWFDGDIAIQAFSTMGVGLKISIKAMIPLLIRNRLIQSISDLKNIYKKYQSFAEHRDTFDKFIKILLFLVKFLIIDYFMACVSYLLSAVVLYMLDTTTLRTILPIYLPGTSPVEPNDIFLNNIVHMFFLAWGGISYLYFDLLFVIQIVHVILLTGLLKDQIEWINYATSDTQKNCKEMKKKMCDAIRIHNQMLTYIEDLSKIYYFPLISLFLAAIGSIAYQAYTIFAVQVPPMSVYVLIITESIELGYYCGFGTVVDISYDKLYEQLLLCNWYLWPHPCKQALIMMMDMAKKPSKMTVADILPLNVNTYIILLNRISSTVMVLRNTL